MRTRLFFSLAFLYIYVGARTQDTIPFRLSPQNNMVISTVLNQKDTVSLMFHTGVSDVSIIEEQAKKIFDLEQSGKVEAKSWGGGGEARYLKNNQLNIGATQWDSLTIWVDKLSGAGTQGKFGPGLFGDQIVEINFDQNQLIIHPSLPDSSYMKSFSKFAATVDRGMLFLEGTLQIHDQYFVDQFMIHSGYSGTVLLNDQFSAKYSIGEQLKTISKSELKDAYGNVLITKKAILRRFHIGGFSFTDIPVNFFEGALGRQKISVIGGELLKRFNMLLDLKRSTIYLKPSQLMQTPF